MSDAPIPLEQALRGPLPMVQRRSRRTVQHAIGRLDVVGSPCQRPLVARSPRQHGARLIRSRIATPPVLNPFAERRARLI